MELKLVEKIKAAVEINGEQIINMENSLVYENINVETNEAFFFIKNNEGKEIKIKFSK